MPQISQILETYASQIFWLLVVFGLIYFVVGKGMFSRVEQTVENRDRKIAEDLAAAERARADAANTEHGGQDKLEAARTEAMRVTQAAKDAAAKANAARLAEIDAGLSGKTADAEASIRQALASSKQEIEQVSADLAGDLVRKLSGVSVDPAELNQSVKAVIGHA